MNILIIGSGGREHALSWKISQSKQCSELYILPGNAGTATIGKNVELSINDFEAIGNFAISNRIDLIVVGPEEPLVKGIVDHFKNNEYLQNIKVVGPSAKGAQLEGSKDFAKDFMIKNGIPTAGYKTFDKTNLSDGLAYIDQLETPIVLKADGLAAGKGVLILESREEAKAELSAMVLNAKFGAASDKVVIEEFLSGIELSVFVLTDGQNYVILPEAKDYKRIGENDEGPNTGGMGAVSPVPFADKYFMQKVEDRIIKPTIDGFAKDQIDYCGFVFIGLMNVNGDPYVIEYNVRMGDPETQAVLTRVENDLVGLLDQSATGKLNEATISISNEVATTVVLVSGGYPNSYEKGFPIAGYDQVSDAIVFHAGTKINNAKEVVTNGGRVIAVTGLGNSVQEALDKTYKGVKNIHWDKCNYRSDIGQDILSLVKE